MPQLINLYQVQIKEKLPFAFDVLLKALTMVAVLLLIPTFIETVTYIRSKYVLSALEQEEQTLAKQLDTIKTKIPSVEKREALARETERLAAEKTLKQEMLTKIVMLKAMQTVGFSKYLTALASQVSQGVWLTGLHFDRDNDYISLSGHALKADYVPRLIEGLSREPIFKGKSFETFKLSLDKKTDNIRFVLSTEDKSPDEKSLDLGLPKK